MNSKINKILNNTNVEDIIVNIKDFLEELKNSKNKEQIENEIVLKAEENLKKLRSKNKTNIDNIQIYEKETSIRAFLAEEIVNGVKRYDLEEVLDTIYKELKRFCKDDKKVQIVTKRTILKLLDEVEEEFKFVSTLENLGINLSFMIFDNPTYADCKFVKYNIFEDRSAAIHKYPMESIEAFDNVFMIMKQIGLFICYILVGESKVVPDDFREIAKNLENNILEDDYEANKNTEIFAEAFTAIFFRKRNIRKKIKIEEYKDADILLEYFNNKLEELYESSKAKKEWDDNEKCPCGSGKKYKDCCKNKEIKYYYKDKNTYTKSMHLNEESKDIMFITKNQFKDIFGRPPGDDDFMISGVLSNELERAVRKMKLEKVLPNDYLYAYDRTGIMLSPYNYNMFSDIEIEQFENARKEYNDLMQADISDNRGNLLQVVEATNIYLKEFFEENIGNMMYVLNKYIKDLTKQIGIPEGFYIKSMEDLMVYSAYRTNTHLEALKELVKNGYSENALAVVRMLFEILINVKVFRKDREIFNEKVLSLAALQEGKCIRKSKFVVVDNETKKEYYCKVKIDKFSEMAGEEYLELYETLYDELSGFIHLDTLTAKKIFEKTDNFLDIDESYIAGVIAMIFATEIIFELSEFENNTLQTRNDLKYYTNNIVEELIGTVEAISLVDEKDTYKVLIQTLKKCKENNNINKQRDARKGPSYT